MNWCVKYDIYCLIDFHGLTPGNPLDNSYKCADEFWQWASSSYKDKKHVIYEIFNEPNGDSNMKLFYFRR